MVGQLRDPLGHLDRAVSELVRLEHLADHAEAVGLVGIDRVAGQEELLGPPRPELPWVGEVLHPAHAEPRPDHVGETGPFGAHDQVTGPEQHESGRVDVAVRLPDRDLAEIAPPACVLEVVVPLLEHQGLGSLACGPVDLPGRVESRSGRPLRSAPPWNRGRARRRTSDPSRPGSRRAPRRPPPPAMKASFSSTRRPRFCALRELGPVEHDARDAPLIERFVESRTCSQPSQSPLGVIDAWARRPYCAREPGVGGSVRRPRQPARRPS